MTEYDFESLQKKLKKELDNGRFQHTLGVMYTAAALAMAHDADVVKAQVAGLMHDCAKCLSDEERIHICKKHQIPISKVEKKAPHLLHGKVGAYLAKKEYGIQDSEILHAISVHTTGCKEMSLLDKIIFVADYIEPGRDKAPRLAEIRKVAFEDIDACVLMILEDTIQYVSKHQDEMDDTTIETYTYYKKLIKERG